MNRFRPSTALRPHSRFAGNHSAAANRSFQTANRPVAAAASRCTYPRICKKSSRKRRKYAVPDWPEKSRRCARRCVMCDVIKGKKRVAVLKNPFVRRTAGPFFRVCVGVFVVVQSVRIDDVLNQQFLFRHLIKCGQLLRRPMGVQARYGRPGPTSARSASC